MTPGTKIMKQYPKYHATKMKAGWTKLNLVLDASCSIKRMCSIKMLYNFVAIKVKVPILLNWNQKNKWESSEIY